MQLDRQEYERLFYEYGPRMQAYATQVLGDAAAAQDLVQDCFLRLWQKYAGEDVESWSYVLFVMLRNSCLNYLKHLTVHHKMVQLTRRDTAAGEELFSYDFTGAQTGALLYDELEREVARAVENLPPRCREVFRLSRFEGLKYGEIAQRLGIGEKAVEKQIGRALKHLRKALAPVWEQ